MPAFTTRTQASDISDITDTYPYIYWLPDYKSLIVSKRVLGGYTLTDSNGVLLRNLDENVYESTLSTEVYLLTISSYQQGDCYTLVYNEVTGWEARQPMMLRKRSETTVYTAPMVTLYSGERVYTNGHSVPSPYKSAGTTLPSDIPPFDDIQDAINDALNATTSVTTQAITINQNITNTYNTYQSGGITETEFNTQMEQYRSELEALANDSGATLADQMAVNNALTNLDITINQQVNNVSPELLSLILNWRQNLNKLFTEFNTGNATQENTIRKLNIINTQISQALGDGSFTSTADVEALNAMQQAVNNTITSVTNYSDLDKNISDAAESSDAAEKEYLESLITETSASIQDISPKNSFSDAEIGTAQEVLSIIWENKLVKRLLVICGCFMVVCVVLGIRYKI